MSRVARSAAMTGEIDVAARRHLLRTDGQEDICFALWRPSTGWSRTTALIGELVLPGPGERHVHGNASFEPQYLERAMVLAKRKGCGLALLHSHPRGRGWQGMSDDDVRAEQGNAAAVFGATGFPFVGLTLAGDGAWSARFWERTAPRTYPRAWCGTVRVIGARLSVSYNNALAPMPRATDEQIRTVSAWGADCQADLARLRIGVIGAGSVGGIIAEALARTGFEDILVMDFDAVEKHNLDRLVYATRNDVGHLKVDVLERHLNDVSTASPFRVEKIDKAVYEEAGMHAALDCDVLIACVDRPWGRYVLNLIACAHLIPVVDGGISVRTNRFGHLAAADWRAHTVAPGRACLQCLGQYDPAYVQMEREGMLDDPSYIENLPKDHPLKARENVFAFALACGAMQILQLIAYIVAPLGLSNPGAQHYHFVGNTAEPVSFDPCRASCVFRDLIGLGDQCGIVATGSRPSAPSNVKKNRPRQPRWRRWLRSLHARLLGGQKD